MISQHRARMGFALLLTSLLVLPILSFSSHASLANARKGYDGATRMRTTLESQPESSRTLADYDKAIKAFRAVYLAAPQSSKAPAALEAVAELYEEMGRRFSDSRSFHTSLAAYDFLRKQYPQSSMARGALLAAAEIYRTDLHDPADARKSYQEYLRLYPKSSKAQAAREALKETQDGSERGGNDMSSSTRRAKNRGPFQNSSGYVPVESENAPPGQTLEVTSIRRWVGPNYTRIVIGVNGDVKFEAVRLSSPDRLVFDLSNARPSPELLGKTFPVEDGFLRQIRVALFRPTVTRVVLDVEQIEDYSVFPLPNPFRLVIDVHGPPRAMEAKNEPPASISSQPGSRPNSRHETSPTANRSHPATSATASAPPGSLEGKAMARAIDQPPPFSNTGNSSNGAPPFTPGKAETRKGLSDGGFPAVRTPPPTSDGAQTLTRALGLKIGRIVIDPGHGGHDTGTIGPNGLTEKDLVLDVGLRLAHLLRDDAGSEVVMTRDDDTFIPLEERTAIANEKAADLFISIHANASHDSTARGIETYYLNFTSDADALGVAARENATSQESVHQLRDLIKKIALSEKIEESREFATQVQRQVHDRLAKAGGKQQNRGVKKAPFVVLIGANMPSVLAEISFLTNPRDARLLNQPEYRQKIAQAIYDGILHYVNNLGGVKVAQQVEATSGRPSAEPPRGSSARDNPPPNNPDF